MVQSTHKHARQAKGPIAVILFGSGICILSFLAVIMVSALLILITKNPLVYSDTFSPLAFLVAGALSGLIGRKCFGEGRLFLCCPPLVLLFSLLAGIFLSGGKIAPSALLSEGIFLGAAYLAFFLAKGRRARRKRRR